MSSARALDQAIATGDVSGVGEACRSDPTLVRDYIDDKRRLTWLALAVREGNPDVIAAMLDQGFNIDAFSMPENSTPLDTAIRFDRGEVVELLLTRGANPNLGRPLIGALNERKSPEQRLRYVRLLVEHGADVNRLYDLYGDPNNQFTALDWTHDPAVIAYLRKYGAKTASELVSQRGSGAQSRGSHQRETAL